MPEHQPQTLRITIAQPNPVVGDLDGNAAMARALHAAARAAGSDFLALPEMFVTGYPPQDMVQNLGFTRAAMAAVEQLAHDCADGPAIGIGGPLARDDRFFNAWFVLEGGHVTATIRKHHLAEGCLFDESRFFTPAPIAPPVTVGGVRIGVPICEDIWHEDVARHLAQAGAEILLVPNGSPYHRGKQARRLAATRDRVRETGLPLIYHNLVGGQDELILDGASFALNADGGLALQLPAFTEELAHIDLKRGANGWEILPGHRETWPEDAELDYRAMCTGLGDYLRKSGFSRVLLGLSGGVDSALVAAIAADTLGADNVRCVRLPSEYSSRHSLDDAEAVAAALGCPLDTVPIDGGRAAVAEALAPLFAGLPPDVTEENIQSRLRGLLLMALSNKTGTMLLTTGNKSESAVGYCTIYGDMCGGYNPLKDLYKTRVFQACRWRNANWRDWMKGPQGEVIPPRVIDKPPSAELRPDQKDEDSLPPYALLDQILESLIEHDLSLTELAAEGYDPQLLRRVAGLVGNAEWKRRQGAPGPRLTTRAFGVDRRYPMANRWRGEL